MSTLNKEKRKLENDINETLAKKQKQIIDFSKASNKKDWNFKIVSWNVNGLRAWFKKGSLDYLNSEDPDIFCCQETKCDTSKIPPMIMLPHYHCYWTSGNRQGYAGVGVMSKVKPLKVSYGINNEKFDQEGRVIVAEFEKFFLINTYVPHAGEELVRLPYRLEWAEIFRKYIADLEKIKPIIWTGDFNVAHNRIDLKYPSSHLRSACFTVEERECFTNILSDGYFDSFRFLYPSQTGAYTFYISKSYRQKDKLGLEIGLLCAVRKAKRESSGQCDPT